MVLSAAAGVCLLEYSAGRRGIGNELERVLELDLVRVVHNDKRKDSLGPQNVVALRQQVNERRMTHDA